MSNNLEIVRAVYSGLSQRRVASTHHVQETQWHCSSDMRNLKAGLH